MTLSERREKLLTDWRAAMVNVQAAEQQLTACKARVTGLEAQLSLVTELLDADAKNGSDPTVLAPPDLSESLE